MAKEIVNLNVSAPCRQIIRTAVLAGMASLTLLSAPVLADSLTGEWIATAEVPGGGVSESLTVVETDDGYELTARLIDSTPGMPEAGPGIDIVIDGDSFSFKRRLGDIAIVYAGIVSGDSFSGTADIGGTQVPYTGVRIVEGD